MSARKGRLADVSQIRTMTQQTIDPERFPELTVYACPACKRPKWYKRRSTVEAHLRQGGPHRG